MTPMLPDKTPSRRTKHKTLKQILQIAAVPVLTVAITVGIWARVPKPQIPTAFRSVSEQLKAVGEAATGSTTYHSSSDTKGKNTGGTSNLSSLTQPGGLITVGKTHAEIASASGTQKVTPGISDEKTLVALGDSITFGFGLPGATADQPSHEAFPFLVAKAEGMNTVDLGVSGWTSNDLLFAVRQPAYKAALRQASLVTIDIGSNDLLHASYSFLKPNAALPPKNDILNSAILDQAVNGYVTDLPKIIRAVQSQTQAPIVLVNLYDPFPDGSSLHDIAEQAISAANDVIWKVGAENGLPVVDAYSAFNHHQGVDVRLNDLDIHPTAAGQKVLAHLIEETVASPKTHIPRLYAISNPGTLVYPTSNLAASPIGWIRGNTGVLMTDVQKSSDQVLLPTGETGYVAPNNLTLLTRPWADEVQFGQQQVSVQKVSITTYQPDHSAVSGDGFVWKGTVYMPLKVISKAVGGTMQENGSTRTVALETPLHSGLIQSGWASLNGGGSGSSANDAGAGSSSAGSEAGAANGAGSPGAGSSAGAANGAGNAGAGSAAGAANGAGNTGAGSEAGAANGAGSGDVSLVFAPTAPVRTGGGVTGSQTANLVMSGWLLKIDGEATSLAHPIVQFNGVLYAPAEAVWTALGGTVSHGTGGLLTLSASGS